MFEGDKQLCAETAFRCLRVTSSQCYAAVPPLPDVVARECALVVVSVLRPVVAH